MSDYLLIVPENLANEHFENCKVVSEGEGTRCLSGLRLLAAENPCSWLAVTNSTDADSVREMVMLRTGTAREDRRIVLAHNSIPSDLRASFPEALHVLLQPVHSNDLLCLSSAAIQEAMATDSMLTAAFRGSVEMVAVTAASGIDRLPQAGPETPVGRYGLSPAIIESLSAAALSGLKVLDY